MAYTTNKIKDMKQKCKTMVAGFCSYYDKMRESIDLTDPEFDGESYAIPEDAIKQLFNNLCAAMNLQTGLKRFRDDDINRGKYSEHSDTVELPLSIDYHSTKEICAVILHELYHAFQYKAICSPTDYPCFASQTIDTWKYEFNNYYSGQDHSIYANQEIEKTARTFVEEILK